MGQTSHISDAYDAFSSYCISFSLISSLMKVSLMTILTMMALDPGLPLNLFHLLCAHFWNYPLIVFVDCHVMESQNLFVVSVEYFQSEYFPAQKFPAFEFIIINMITVCCRLAHSFKTMARRELVVFEVFPPRTVQRLCSVGEGEDRVWSTCCVKGQETKFMIFGLLLRTELVRFTHLLGSKSATISPGRLFTLIFLMQKHFELLSWAADPATEVFNGSMFLGHLAKLELLP